MAATVERAYQLADSGTVANVTDILGRLKKEGFTDCRAQLAGGDIRQKLRRRIAAAKYNLNIITAGEPS